MPKSLFDHLNVIYQNQDKHYFDTLDDSEQKTLNPYMMNRAISMNPDFITLVNEFQKFYVGSGSRETYLFYSQIIPKGKYFNKFVKKEKETKYEEWLVDVVGRYFSISKNEANQYLNIFYSTDAGKTDLKNICEFFGTDSKLIKKVKL